jgi:hypothetical protein
MAQLHPLADLRATEGGKEGNWLEREASAASNLQLRVKRHGAWARHSAKSRQLNTILLPNASPILFSFFLKEVSFFRPLCDRCAYTNSVLNLHV